MKNNFLKIFISISMIMLPISVFAHPGRLDKSGCHKCNADNTNCAKWGLDDYEYHCHSGNTYTNSKGDIYDKAGTKISSGSTSNENTTQKEETTNNDTQLREEISNDNQQVETPSTNTGNKDNTTSNKESQTPELKPTVSTPIQKSEDTSLKFIKIDNKEITILDEMIYETDKKNIDLNVEPTDDKSSVEFNNKELILGENEIIIKVTAEAGNTKEYKLTIIKNETSSPVTIKTFKLNSSEITFKNNKATTQKLTNETSFEYSYELSDKNAKLLIYVNNREVSKLDNIRNGDIIKLVIIDIEDNKNSYEIEVTEYSKLASFIINAIAYTFVAIILLSPIIVIGIFIYIKRRKK